MADSPANIEAATFARNLVAKKLVNQPGGTYNAFNEAAAGKLGMFGAGIWPNSSHPAGPERRSTASSPSCPGRRRSRAGLPVGVGGFPMFKSTKNKKALWEFIKYSVSQEFQHGPVVNFGGDMPIRPVGARAASRS